MLSSRTTRRTFLALPLALVLAPAARALAQDQKRRSDYEVEIGILYNALRYRVAGTLDERVDRAGGRYEMRQEATGTGIASRSESYGVMRGGRWVPVHTASWVRITGREGFTDVSYDYDRQVVHYKSRSETFFLGRLRVVDDLVAIPPGIQLDDTVSAVLNHADGRWLAEPSGALEMRMVRRRRDRREATEEVPGTYRAEIVPVTLKVVPGPADGKRTALVDLTGFSAWALADQPARMVFTADGRPESITARLMYGTTLSVRFTSG
jgi:hypothetical protein